MVLDTVSLSGFGHTVIKPAIFVNLNASRSVLRSERCAHGKKTHDVIVERCDSCYIHVCRGQPR